MFTWREKIADSSDLPEESRKQLKREIETIIASHQKDFHEATDGKDMKKAIETAVKMKYFYKVSEIVVFLLLLA
jgi:cation transport regulator ChaB